MSAPPLPPNYVMLNDPNGQHLKSQHNRRNLPRYHSNRFGPQRSGGNCCLKCICCCYCCLFIIIITLTLFSYILYIAFKPEVPTFKIENFEAKTFNVLPDFSINTELAVTIKADNPNEYIGFKYGKDSLVTVGYTDKILCSGKIPEFYQPEKNVSLLRIPLKGKTEFGSVLQESLIAAKKARKIPLVVLVKLPVIVEVSKFPLKEVVPQIQCYVIINSLQPGKNIQVLSTRCEVKDFGV